MKTIGAISCPGYWKKYRILIFFLLFMILITAFYLVYFNPWLQNHVFNPFTELSASFGSSLLDLLGYHTTVSGHTIGSEALMINVKKGCDAIEPMAIFVAAIIAFPASFREKSVGLVAGLLLLFLLNVIRLVTMFMVGVHRPAAFEAMHIGVWQVIFILFAVGIWFIWLTLINRRKGIR